MIYSKSFLHLLLLLVITISSLSLGQPQTRDAFDDLIAFVDSPEVCEIIGNTNFEAARTANKAAVLVLFQNVGITNLIQENLFLRSNVIRTRSLLDYPWNLPWRHDKDKKAVFVDLFYNQTTRAFFTDESSNICTYLALTNDGFLQQLQNVLNRLRSTDILPDVNVDQILELVDLFTTFTVQERRLGLMLGGKKAVNCWHFTVMAPWYYLERNHFVDDRVQQDLMELSQVIFGAPKNICELHAAERRQHELEDAYLISDKFGIGDTRIYADFPIIKKEKLTTRLGILTTLPTAFAWKKGLKGSSLHLIKSRPQLDFLQIFEDGTAAQQGAPFTNTQPLNFAFAVLENLGAMLLESPMGNGGHFGLGTYIRNRSPLTSLIKQNWASDVTMRSFISLEYLFPATEWRSFRVPVEEALFNSVNFLEPEENFEAINANYAFLVQQFTNRLIPYALQARVHPGIVFRWSSQMFYEGCDWFGFSFGTDTYVRNKEKLSSVDASDATKRIIDQYHARYPTAYQAKIAGSLFFKIDKPDKFWTISLFADYTYMNKGIGSDFTLTLNTDVSF